MKLTQHRILIALGLLAIVGALVCITSCGPKKQKIDETTVLPFKDKAELDKLLGIPILPEYTIEEYYTKTDFITGDELFVVCCKFLEKVSPEEVQKIVAQVDSVYYHGWYTFDLGKKNNMHLFFDLDTTLTDRKMPEPLGNNIHVSVELRARANDSWKGFDVLFRNNRADYSVIVDRDTLTKVLGVEMPPLKETTRSDESIYFEFDTVPSEEFYQALEKAPHWQVSHRGDMTFYFFDYDDGEHWITVDLVKGETQLSFYRNESMKSQSASELIDKMKERMSPSRDKKDKGESK